MKRNLIETLMGAVVLIVAVFFVFTTYQNSGIKKDYGYQLSANFDKVDGITTGSDVRLGGIKIGTVIGAELDPKTYRARVRFGIRKDIQLPTDTTAEIVSDGLLGGKYVNIVPGAETDMLKDGGEIEYTQSSVNLEQLIGKIAFGGTDSSAKAAAKPDAQAAPAAAPAPAVKAEPKPQTKTEIKPEPSAKDETVVSAPAKIEASTHSGKQTPRIEVPVESKTSNDTSADDAAKPVEKSVDILKSSPPPKPIEEAQPISTPKPSMDINKAKSSDTTTNSATD